MRWWDALEEGRVVGIIGWPIGFVLVSWCEKSGELTPCFVWRYANFESLGLVWWWKERQEMGRKIEGSIRKVGKADERMYSWLGEDAELL